MRRRSAGTCVDERPQEKSLEGQERIEARVGALLKKKTIQRSAVRRLGINGRASEGREEWMEEVIGPCERQE